MADLTFQDLPRQKLPAAPASAPSASPQALEGGRTDLRVITCDGAGETVSLPARGLVKITVCDRKAAELARVTDLTAEISLMANAGLRATEACPTGSGLEVTLTDADGRVRGVMWCNPGRGLLTFAW